MMRGTVVISGAGKGIGRATAEAFVDAGWECVAIDVDADALRQLELHLVGRPGRVRSSIMDLIDVGTVDWNQLSAGDPTANRLALVNNLGGSQAGPTNLEQIGWARFQSVLTFNLKGTLLLTQACLPVMRRFQWGRIVNVSSVAGRSSLSFVGADYCAAKSAVLGFSRKLSDECAADGILVNTICPGIIATERIQQRWASRSNELNKEILEQIPSGALGTPAAVARSIYHLASDENSYITGAVLDINGGLHRE